MRREHVTALSVVLTGDQPPSEFRVFTAGKVDTSKGTFVFDADAAASVMTDYAKQGNELMVDYDHASLAGLSIDPAQAGKAAGWFNLELRAGELWAVNVRWTAPASAQLSAKEWRYMSPAFQTDEAGHITSLLNVALTNIPATRNLAPLMAASLKALAGDTGMDPKLISDALDALAAGDDAKCAEILKAMIASAAGGEIAEPADGAGAPAEQMGDAPDMPDDKKKEDPAAVAASISRMMRLSDAKSFVELLSKFETYRTSHLELETERTALAAERKTAEAAERRALGAKLVTDCARAPASVWASSDRGAPLKPYYANMPIADFRQMVADQLSAKPGATPRPPAGGGKIPRGGSGDGGAVVDAHGNTAQDLVHCKATGCDPGVYAMLKARRDTNKTT